MWDRFLSDDAAQRMAASGCGAQIGNLVPWPLVRFWRSKLFSVKLDGCGCQIRGLFSEIFFLIKFWSTFKSWTTDSQVNASFRHAFNLRFRLATHLRWLALTLIELKFVRKFFNVWSFNASRHKLIASHLYMREVYELLRLVWIELASRSVRPPITSPYILKLWFCKLASTCDSVWPRLLNKVLETSTDLRSRMNSHLFISINLSPWVYF